MLNRMQLLALPVALLALSTPARARSVDYAALEQAFGEPVTTSVTGSPQRASEVAASLIIISREDIRRSQAQDIPGLLKAYAGIDVVRWTSGQSDVFLRGGVRPVNPSLLVLVNGRKVLLDFFNTVFWQDLGVQLDEIQQIEVVKGPSSALFGFNATSGVINIITINPLQTEQVSVTAEGSPNHGARGSLVIAKKLREGLGLRLSADIERIDEFDSLRRSQLVPPGAILRDPDKKDASVELNAALDPVTDLSLSLSYTQRYGLDVIPQQLLARERAETTSASLRLSRDMKWGTIQFHADGNWVDLSSDTSLVQPITPFDETRTFMTGVDTLIRLGSRNVLRLGAEYRALSYREDAGYPSPTEYHVFSGSATWEHRFGDAFRLTLAGRLDHLKLRHDGALDQPTLFTSQDYDRNFTTWSMNAALWARLDENSSLRLAGGRGVQVPSLLELSLKYPIPIPGLPVPLVTLGNPRLDPTPVWSVEIGYSRDLSRIDAKLELAAFYNDSGGLISPPVPNGLPAATPPAKPFIAFVASDIGHWSSYGLEASLKGKIDTRWSWMLNYSWTKVDAEIPDNTHGIMQWPYAPDRTTPRHKVNAQISYEKGSWLATILAYYTAPTDQPINNFGSYSLQHLNGSVEADAKIVRLLDRNISVSVSGDNLLASSGANLSQFAAERRVWLGAKFSF